MAELSPGKLLAGAGAAATSAVIGSTFGAEGTVMGAAVGSAISTVAAALYQRWLEQAGKTVRTRLTTIRGHRPGYHDKYWDSGRTGHTGRRAGLRTALVAAVGGFVLAMLAVTGVELVHGGSLSGGNSGTSIGTVAGGGAPATPDRPGTGSDRGSARSPARTAPSAALTPTVRETAPGVDRTTVTLSRPGDDGGGSGVADDPTGAGATTTPGLDQTPSVAPPLTPTPPAADLHSLTPATKQAEPGANR
ncbi:hypothetical protein LWC35_30985 [Pseudonocardia kujensis]|uniref:hypothetical protein n=1 Tax=Pseudonocardia kujensis TaxID=1128675 RepID=UPI001E377AC1|nr:hypothetical protein [Pseudonocardia kujensis]MCE0767296.1 hypothetical protein [Pseudonocardia kujensis]